MSYRNLSEDEKELFDLIIEDLRFLFSVNEILPQDIPDVLSKLKSEEVKAYVNSLSQGAKPETALREAFFAGKSLLSKYLGGESTPEVNLGPGFIDYILKVDGRIVLIELKPLFEADFEEGKIRSLKRLKQTELKWQRHKNQILKYIQKGSDFIILTDLKDWFFFNKTCSPADFNYFFKVNLFDFIEEYNVIADLWDYLRRKDSQAIREGLDKRFFESLKKWVSKLSEVEFNTDEKAKVELTIRLLNKFIFIQTLDDFFVIDARWIKTNWDEIERKWRAKGKYQVLKEFFEEIDKWFYEYYDTELFRDNILKHVKTDAANIEKLYNSLQLVLGLSAWQPTFSSFKGIMQYNFRHIDEDIFGKAYETFLAEVRHDEGIYYTPKYITEYIVENTVGKIYDKLLSDIEECIKAEDFDKAKGLIQRFVSIRVLDPACGSGSFLVKTVRKIMEKYRKLNGLIKELDSKYNKYAGTLVRPTEVENNVQRVVEFAGVVKAKNDRELISRLLIRHIHGNDLDGKALEVAKVNIWLEAIKLAPTEFRFDKLPMDTNHILPDLEMNLVNGNTVVGLPENLAVDFLHKNFGSEMHKLSELRKQYLEDPTMPELVVQIEEIQRRIRNSLDEEFKRYLTEKELSTKILEETKPLHWPLELWYLYFVDGKPLDKNLSGADVVIGNPPYERIQVLKKKSPHLVVFLNNAGFEATTKNYDLAVIFIEKGYELLNENGRFGYIVTNKFMVSDYGEGIREFLRKNNAISQLISFGDEQVFEGAITYTALLFLDKTKNEQLKYARVRKLEYKIDQLFRIRRHDVYDSNTETVFWFDSKSLTRNPWVLISPLEEEVLNKIKGLDKLKEVTARIFQGLVTGADAVFILQPVEDYGNLIKVYSRSKNKEYVLEKDLIKKFLYGRNLQKWLVPEHEYVILFPYLITKGKARLIDKESFASKFPKTWKYLNDNQEILESRERGKWKGVDNWYALGRRQNLEQFEQPKIMTQVLAYRSSFSIDKNDYFYFAGAGGSNGYGITFKGNLSLSYVCGLLNSTLLDWNLKKISTSHKGGYWIYAKRFLERLPIKIPKTREEKKFTKMIENTVDKIIVLKDNRFTLLKIWGEISARLKSDDRSLSKILSQDEHTIRDGDFDNIWTSRVSFYPSTKNEILSKEFNDFTIVADSEKPLLEVYGLTGEGEEKIFEFEFPNRELMLHSYYCLVVALSSRQKIKTLNQLLNKTMVPVIQPNITKSTVNIIKKLEKEFAEKEQKKAVETDITKIANSILDFEAQIDSVVFKLYGLNVREANTIMHSLRLLPSYQQLVLKHFK